MYEYNFAFEDIKGMVFESVTLDSDLRVIFKPKSEDFQIVLYHSPDCCETVNIDDVCGDLHDLEDTEILSAIRTHMDLTPSDPGADIRHDQEDNYYFKIDTAKGSVTIRWYGSSNGWYSTEVECVKLSNTKLE